jgi:hypothetical protein
MLSYTATPVGFAAVANQPTDPEKMPEPESERRPAGLELTPPPCAHCGSADTAAVIRTCGVVYVRCLACAFLWKHPRPSESMKSNDAPYTGPERRIYKRLTIPRCER